MHGPQSRRCRRRNIDPAVPPPRTTTSPIPMSSGAIDPDDSCSATAGSASTIRGAPVGSDEPPAVLAAVDGRCWVPWIGRGRRAGRLAGTARDRSARRRGRLRRSDPCPSRRSTVVAWLHRPGRSRLRAGFVTGAGRRVVGVGSEFAPMGVALWARRVSGLKLGTPEPVVPPMSVPPKIHSSTSPGLRHVTRRAACAVRPLVLPGRRDPVRPVRGRGRRQDAGVLRPGSGTAFRVRTPRCRCGR